MAAEVGLSVGQVLQSSSREYTILEFIREGSFAKVAKCRVGTTKELVAMKILQEVEDVRQELSMLRKLSRVNSDNMNLIKFYERFDYFGLTFLVFELLDINLFQLLQNHLCSPMWVYEIRPIAKQMLVALQALKDLEIIHTDIKPDNIMLTNMGESPNRVKLIDFGLALPSFYPVYERTLQPMGYRAPEIILGLPFTEAIDMWGLGCTLAFLYLRGDLFPFDCDYLIMKTIVETLGMPSDYQLHHGAYTGRFFLEEEDESGYRWRLLTPEEYSAIHDKPAEEWPLWYPHFYSLDDLLNLFIQVDAEEMKDRREFMDFLKQVLHLDQGKRISPEVALQHPFITMSHLSQDPSDYQTKAQAFMSTSVPSLNDVVGYEDIDVGHTVLLTTSPGQCEPIAKNVTKELCLHSTEDDPGIQSHQEQCSLSCLETLDSVSSLNGSVVEDIPTLTPTRFSSILRRVRKFFSRIRKKNLIFLPCSKMD